MRFYTLRSSIKWQPGGTDALARQQFWGASSTSKTLILCICIRNYCCYYTGRQQETPHSRGRFASQCAMPPFSQGISPRWHQPSISRDARLYAPRAICFLISAIALPGLRPLGQARVQLRMVWHRYRLIEFSRLALRSALRSSRESANHRYDCSRMAGPRYSSEFHQYEGHDVEQHAQRMHSYRPSSFRRSSFD